MSYATVDTVIQDAPARGQDPRPAAEPGAEYTRTLPVLRGLVQLRPGLIRANRATWSFARFSQHDEIELELDDAMPHRVARVVPLHGTVKITGAWSAADDDAPRRDEAIRDAYTGRRARL